GSRDGRRRVEDLQVGCRLLHFLPHPFVRLGLPSVQRPKLYGSGGRIDKKNSTTLALRNKLRPERIYFQLNSPNVPEMRVALKAQSYETNSFYRTYAGLMTRAQVRD